MSEYLPQIEPMKELYKIERTERFDLYRQFYQTYDEYQERMHGPVNDYYHTVKDDSGLGSFVVLERKTPNSNVGPYIYLSLFTHNETGQGSNIRVTRSMAIAKHHYSLRWKFFKQLLYETGPNEGLSIKFLDAGPTARYGGGKTWKSYCRYSSERSSFTPEPHWTPKGDERAKVRHVLSEAIGLIASIGFKDNSVLLNPEVKAKHSLR